MITYKIIIHKTSNTETNNVRRIANFELNVQIILKKIMQGKSKVKEIQEYFALLWHLQLQVELSKKQISIQLKRRHWRKSNHNQSNIIKITEKGLTGQYSLWTYMDFNSFMLNGRQLQKFIQKIILMMQAWAHFNEIELVIMEQKLGK